MAQRIFRVRTRGTVRYLEAVERKKKGKVVLAKVVWPKGVSSREAVVELEKKVSDSVLQFNDRE